MSTPKQKRGESRQDYETPAIFLRPVNRRFGPLAWDLAATKENAKAPRFIAPEEDSLKLPWWSLSTYIEAENGEGWLWLNPPFANISVWAEKCAAEMKLGARILLLTPASVGANWYVQHVRPYAHSIFLNGRITFAHESDPYPKDLMLSVFAWGLTGDSCWRWQDGKTDEPCAERATDLTQELAANDAAPVLFT